MARTKSGGIQGHCRHIVFVLCFYVAPGIMHLINSMFLPIHSSTVSFPIMNGTKHLFQTVSLFAFFSPSLFHLPSSLSVTPFIFHSTQRSMLDKKLWQTGSAVNDWLFYSFMGLLSLPSAWEEFYSPLENFGFSFSQTFSWQSCSGVKFGAQLALTDMKVGTQTSTAKLHWSDVYMRS